MNLKKWISPVVLLAAIVIGERIYLHRPDFKYRLTIEVETPHGVTSASGVMSVHPNRSYGGSGSGSSQPRTKGDALFVDLGGGQNLVALLLHGTNPAESDGMTYLPLRALAAIGQRIDFRDIKRQTQTIPITADLIPKLVTVANPADPKTARVVDAADLGNTIGAGLTLKRVSLVVVPVGMWPLDVGGIFGEPITRQIDKHLPWANDPARAAVALDAAGIVLAKVLDSAPDPAGAFRSR